MGRKKILKFKKPKQLRVNWAYIKPIWCSNRVSNLEICREYNEIHKDSKEWKTTVHEAGIRTNAKRKGWKRDISDKVLKKYKENIARPSERIDLKFVQSEDEIIEQAALIPTAMRNMQRARARKLGDLCDKLHDQLVKQLLLDTDKMTKTVKRLTLASLVSIFNSLMLATSRLQTMESEAFGLNETGTDEAALRQIALNEVISMMPVTIQEELRKQAAKRQKLLG